VLVLSVDARRTAAQRVRGHHPRRPQGHRLDAVEWARRAAELGAGEILLNSMDADGTKAGFDLELIAAVRKRWSTSRSSPAGARARSSTSRRRSRRGADAVLAASVFHFGLVTVDQVGAACHTGAARASTRTCR
jgi:cyclase